MGLCCSKGEPQQARGDGWTSSTSSAGVVQTQYQQENPTDLAEKTYFSVNEVAALYTLFSKVSNTLVQDGLIHKEEFQLALFGNSSSGNLFMDRVFELFDQKQNGVIEFGEFVKTLSVFHPSASRAEKAEFAFRVYDVGNTGSIDKMDVSHMLTSVIQANPTMKIDNKHMELLLEKTFGNLELENSTAISKVEWHELTINKPGVLKNMTLESLRSLTLRYPSFMFLSSGSPLPNKARTTDDLSQGSQSKRRAKAIRAQSVSAMPGGNNAQVDTLNQMASPLTAATIRSPEQGFISASRDGKASELKIVIGDLNQDLGVRNT